MSVVAATTLRKDTNDAASNAITIEVSQQAQSITAAGSYQGKSAPGTGEQLHGRADRAN